MNIDECAKVIEHCGKDVSCLVQGEPGIGKSSLLKILSGKLPEHETVYIDAPLFDVPDVALPYVDKEAEETRYAPNSVWKINSGKPLLIMIDELGKCSGPTKLVFTRLLLERSLGDRKLPEGSIVFATSNNAQDGVGDHVAAHLSNRITRLDMRKPSSDEWIKWSMENGGNQVVMSWVDQFPQALLSYKDDENNPYVFHPKKNTTAFVSPRSLEKAGKIIDRRESLGLEIASEALSGCIGPSAARDMEAFMLLEDSLPDHKTIVEAPAKTPLPKNIAAQMMLLYGSVGSVTNKNLPQWLVYMQRMQAELQAVWARVLMNSESKGPVCCASQEFMLWARGMEDVL